MAKDVAKRKCFKKAYNPTNILTYLRTYTGMTQSELASATGLTNNDISRFERKHHNLSIGKLQRLSEYFQVSMDILWKNDLSALSLSLSQPTTRENYLREQIHQQQQRCEQIGDIGEAWVAEIERKRLAGTPYEALVNPNFSCEENAHFDILSFDPTTGEPIMIEVKATSGGMSEPLYMSEGEYSLLTYATEHNLRYELHRVYHVTDKRRRSRIIYTAQDLLAEFEIQPTAYILRKREVA